MILTTHGVDRVVINLSMRKLFIGLLRVIKIPVNINSKRGNHSETKLLCVNQPSE